MNIDQVLTFFSKHKVGDVQEELKQAILAAHNAELDRIADKERVCKKCLKPYNAPSLCPICEKLLANNIS